MKRKSKSSWGQLYLIAGAGCTMLLAEGLLALHPLERHLILIITLLVTFWLMQQWLKNNRTALTRMSNLVVRTYDSGTD